MPGKIVIRWYLGKLPPVGDETICAKMLKLGELLQRTKIKEGDEEELEEICDMIQAEQQKIGRRDKSVKGGSRGKQTMHRGAKSKEE